MAAHDLSISDEMSNLQGLFEKHSLLIDFIFTCATLALYKLTIISTPGLITGHEKLASLIPAVPLSSQTELLCCAKRES